MTPSKEIKFSVIIPVYNVEDYLKECLDSIFAYQGELEVIAVDDGSTDSSGKILDEYPDERLKVFHKENEGVFKTWQYGVKKSTGDYLIFVDSDDYIDSKLFPDLLEILSERDYDLIQFGWTDIAKDKRKVNGSFKNFHEGALEGDELQNYLETALYRPANGENVFHVCRWGKAFRAKPFKAFLPELMDDIFMFEDDSTVLPFLTTIRSLYMTEKPYYFHRTDRPGSICNDLSKLQGRWRDCKNILDYFEGFRGGVLLRESETFYIEKFCYRILVEAVTEGQYKLAKEVLRDKRFQKYIEQGKGFKYFLFRHGMVRTYRFFRGISKLFKK